uniref:Photolyase/cryptochrome alpha/beta domain-containing protein n=1 Tax=Varanus komodoensis TaxID=61221 RepID=A0A8D2J573_VARKO
MAERGLEPGSPESQSRALNHCATLALQKMMASCIDSFQAACWRLASSVRPIGGLWGPWSVPGAVWAMPQKRQKQKRPTSAEAEDNVVEDGAVADGLGSPGRAEVAGALQGAKRKKVEGDAGSGGAGGLAETVRQSRLKTAPSVAEFKYNKKRVRLISENPDLKEGTRGIVYWMSRDQRVQDNWAFLYAQRLALKQKLPLHVCFCLVPKFLEATIRHFG